MYTLSIFWSKFKLNKIKIFFHITLNQVNIKILNYFSFLMCIFQFIISHSYYIITHFFNFVINELLTTSNHQVGLILIFMLLICIFQFKYNHVLQLYKQIFIVVVYGISHNTFSTVYSHWYCSILQ